jgi:hypothetical protein
MASDALKIFYKRSKSMKRIIFAERVLAKAKLTGTAALALAFILVMAGCKSPPPPSYPVEEPAVSVSNDSTLYGIYGEYSEDGGYSEDRRRIEEGVYIGLISFAGTTKDLTDGAPIRLDSAGKNSLISKLDNEYKISSQGGTALFYGVHQALANLKANETNYPDNLDSVNMITFTDGLDNGSTGQAAVSPIEGQSPETIEGYAEYVKEQITTRPIAEKSITAYSVGVRGNDVNDIPAFRNALSQIASVPGNAKELTNFETVQAAFDSIASGLNVIVDTYATFTVATTLLPSGTKVRMTFDAAFSANPENSNKWIEGTINRMGTGTSLTYTLSGIRCKNMSSSEASGPITGTINGSEVNFVFTGVTGLPRNLQQDDSRVKQWFQTSGNSAWQYNSEYSMGNSVSNTIEKRSSVIYLVLDSSKSLNAYQIDQIREAVKSFINSLYDEITQAPQ